MTKCLLMFTRWRVALAFMFVLAFIAGAVFITHGALSSVTFFGCLTPGGTLVRIGFTSQPCPGNTTAVFWNQTGPQGPAGPAGPTGPAGPAGSAAMFKAVSFPPLLLTLSSTTLASVVFTAPSRGFALAIATGSCFGSMTLLDATLDLEVPGAFLIPGSEIQLSSNTALSASPKASWATSGVVAVSSGSNTINLVASGRLNETCSGNLTVLFSPSLLP